MHNMKNTKRKISKKSLKPKWCYQGKLQENRRDDPVPCPTITYNPELANDLILMRIVQTCKRTDYVIPTCQSAD